MNKPSPGVGGDSARMPGFLTRMTQVRFSLSSRWKEPVSPLARAKPGSVWKRRLHLNYKVCKWLNAALMRTNQSLSLRPPTPTGVLRRSDRRSGANSLLKISVSLISNTFSIASTTFFFSSFSYIHTYIRSLRFTPELPRLKWFRVVAKKAEPLPKWHVGCGSHY